MLEVFLMELEKMKTLLSGEYEIVDVESMPHGNRISLQNGAIVNVYNKGTYNVQGKNNVEVAAYIEENNDEPTPVNSKKKYSKKVFIVYGHDEDARNELELLLRRWELEPIILDQMPSGGQTIIEKLETYSQDVHYGIVLATPDDEGYRKGATEEKMYRCRQNVVLEMGMLLAKLGRDRVAILQKHPSKTERPSDIQGLVYIPFEDKIDKGASALLAKEVENKLKVTIPASNL